VSGNAPEASPRGRGGRRLRRLVIGALVAGVIGLAGAEAALRFGAGLGDPPLFDRDPAIEYVLKPSRTFHYRHHTYSVNSHRMRGPEFPARKAEGELRVMVIGDSLLEGGGRIDQTELATEQLRIMLTEKFGRPVTVGNISAPSWGPPNQLAFIKQFGLFDADVVVLVSNSGDYDDVPGLEALGAVWPQRSPVLAIQEVLGRQLERRLPGLAIRLGMLSPANPPPIEQREPMAAAALGELIQRVEQSGARFGLVQYWKLSELRSGAEAGHGLIASAASAGTPGIRIWQTREAFISAPTGDPTTLFQPGDDVHPSAAGHRVLAAVLLDAVVAIEAERVLHEPVR